MFEIGVMMGEIFGGEAQPDIAGTAPTGPSSW